MAIENRLDAVLNTKTKVKIIRFLFSRTDDFRTSGRGIAKLIKVSTPATHSALKELYGEGILKLEIIGKQHIYSLNCKNRLVKDILMPGFKKELSLKEDVKHFLINKIKELGINRRILSLVLYGSLQKGNTSAASDADLAVIVRDKRHVKIIEDVFLEKIGIQFSEYFGFHLDTYVKSKGEFKKKIRLHRPPVSTLMKSYSVIFGKDPIEFI